MRHPQDDLLIVYALSRVAQEYKDTPTEDHAYELAAEIANQHGLTAAEAVRQMEERGQSHCWDEDCD